MRIIVRSILALIVGFFQAFGFPSLLVGFSRGLGRQIPGHTSQQPNVLVGLKDQIAKDKFFGAFCTKFIPYHGDSRETLNSVDVKHVLSKGASKTVTTFAQSGINLPTEAILPHLFRTQM